MKDTKTLREFASDEIDQKTKEEGLRDRAKKARSKVKKAGSKAANAIKWLTSDSLNENQVINEGIGDIREFHLFSYTEAPSIEALEVADLLGVRIESIVGTNSKMNPTLFTKYKKILTSKHWQEQKRSEITPDISAAGQLTCFKCQHKFPAVAAFYDDGNSTPCVTFFYDQEDSQYFKSLINHTFLT